MGRGGKGVTIGGQEYSLWFNSEGFRIAPGRSAFGPGSTLISWVNAAAMTSNLLRDGTFATQDKIDAAPDNEVQELAEKLWYLRQDFSDSAKKLNLMPIISQHFLGKGFPDDTKEIAELLKFPLHRQQILRELDAFVDEYKYRPDLLRFRKIHDPVELFRSIGRLSTVKEQYKAVEGFAPAKASFITEDEITRLLTGGPSIAESKLQIYSYFVQGHNAKECADFLKSSYGEGGVNRQKGVPFFATRDGPICATCGIPLSISIPFIWVSRNCGQKLPEVWQSIGLSDLITLLRLRRHLSRMAMPLAKSLTDAV